MDRTCVKIGMWGDDRSGASKTERLEEEQEKFHLLGWNFTLCLQASVELEATAEV